MKFPKNVKNIKICQKCHKKNAHFEILENFWKKFKFFFSATETTCRFVVELQKWRVVFQVWGLLASLQKDLSFFTLQKMTCRFAWMTDENSLHTTCRLILEKFWKNFNFFFFSHKNNMSFCSETEKMTCRFSGLRMVGQRPKWHVIFHSSENDTLFCFNDWWEFPSHNMLFLYRGAKRHVVFLQKTTASM